MTEYKVKTCLTICILHLFFCSCNNNTTSHLQGDNLHQKLEKEAIDTLSKYGKENYADSAYWYFYVYFGSSLIKKCGNVDVDSVLPETKKRRIICHDLALTKARIVPDSSWIYLRVTPLVRDSILSCDMVEGPSLPYELLFNYKTRRFIHFVYDLGWQEVIDIDPINDYNAGLRKIIEGEQLDPHPKFKRLLSEIGSAPD